MLFGACWTPRSSNVETLSAAAIRRAALAHQLVVDAAARGVLGDRQLGERGEHRLAAGRVLGEEGVVDEPLLNDDPEQRGEAPRVGARAHPEVEVGHLGRLGAHRVDHDQRALRVLGELAQRDPRARQALGLPRVLADEHRDLGVLEVAARVAAVQVAVDPALAHLLLRERTRAIPRAERAQQRAGCRRRRDGCPGRRRRSRRSSRRRVRRGRR